MVIKMKKFLICTFITSFLFSCNKSDLEIRQHKFIHIMDRESSTATVSTQSNSIGTYNIYLSAPTREFMDSVVVEYKIMVGDGLTEGVDYQIINKSNLLTFLPGIYSMPVRIRWIANPIEATKDNSITIELVSNNKNYILGLPGPSQNQKSFKIIKI